MVGAEGFSVGSDMMLRNTNVSLAKNGLFRIEPAG